MAAITDFFDGYVARSRGQMSAFGKFMDPVADKLSGRVGITDDGRLRSDF